jgi:hypothetical protein
VQHVEIVDTDVHSVHEVKKLKAVITRGPKGRIKGFTLFSKMNLCSSIDWNPWDQNIFEGD